MEIERTCVVCGSVKPLENFSQYKHKGKVLRRKVCRECKLKIKRSSYTPEQLQRVARLDELRALRKIGKRKCKDCGEVKDISEFGARKDYLPGTCTTCEAAHMREYNDRSRTPEELVRVELLRENRELERYGVRRCKTCDEVKPLTDFERLTKTSRRMDCKECSKFTYIDTEIGFGVYRKCPLCSKFRTPSSFGEHEHCLACRRNDHVKKRITHETCKVCGETLPIISFKLFYDSDGNVQHSFVCDECAIKKPRLSMASIRYGAKV